MDHHFKKSGFNEFINAFSILLIIVGLSITIYAGHSIQPWVQFKLKIYPYAKDKKAIAQGRELYQVCCQGCHGELSQRQHIFNMLTRSHFPSNYYSLVIRYHKTGISYSVNSLSSDELWKIVSYIFDQFYQLSGDKSERLGALLNGKNKG